MNITPPSSPGPCSDYEKSTIYSNKSKNIQNSSRSSPQIGAKSRLDSTRSPLKDNSTNTSRSRLSTKSPIKSPLTDSFQTNSSKSVLSRSPMIDSSKSPLSSSKSALKSSSKSFLSTSSSFYDKSINSKPGYIFF